MSEAVSEYEFAEGKECWHEGRRLLLFREYWAVDANTAMVHFFWKDSETGERVETTMRQEDRVARLAEIQSGQRVTRYCVNGIEHMPGYEEVAWLLAQLDEALEVVADLTAQGCTTRTEDGPLVLDSSASGAYTDAIRFLAEWGKVEITEELSPRWIRAKWKVGV